MTNEHLFLCGSFLGYLYIFFGKMSVQVHYPLFNQIICLFVVELDKQVEVYPYNGYYLALKWNEIPTHDTMWMDLEDIMLSEISQSQKDKYCITPPI